MAKGLLFVLPAVCVLAACQTTQTAQPTPSAEGMLQPETRILVQTFNDGTFSLATLYTRQTGKAVSRSDRREIDEAIKVALSRAPRAPGTDWINEVTEHKGSVDLTDWTVDGRSNELCGTIEHAALLPEHAGGVVVICRDNQAPAWTVDEARWTPAEEKPAARARTVRRSRPSGGGGTTTGGGSTTGGGTTTAGTNPPPRQSPNVRPPNYTPPACPDVQGGGSQTLGDCLAAPTS